jgi:hypothetical protein
VKRVRTSVRTKNCLLRRRYPVDVAFLAKCDRAPRGDGGRVQGLPHLRVQLGRRPSAPANSTSEARLEVPRPTPQASGATGSNGATEAPRQSGGIAQCRRFAVKGRFSTIARTLLSKDEVRKHRCPLRIRTSISGPRLKSPLRDWQRDQFNAEIKNGRAGNFGENAMRSLIVAVFSVALLCVNSGAFAQGDQPIPQPSTQPIPQPNTQPSTRPTAQPTPRPTPSAASSSQPTPSEYKSYAEPGRYHPCPASVGFPDGRIVCLGWDDERRRPHTRHAARRVASCSRGWGCGCRYCW